MNSKKIKNPSLARRLFLLCWLVYFSSYLGRLNYSSAMTVMLDQEILTKAQAGFISMIYFLAYGVGQFLNGFAGDRVNPKRMIAWGLSVSAAMNLIMTVCRDVPVMTAAWFVNGYAQSAIWPPIIRIFSDMLETKTKLKYCVDIVSTQAAGTFASYFLSAAIIAHGRWQFVFLAAAVILAAAAAVWNLGFSAVKRRADAQSGETPGEGEETDFGGMGRLGTETAENIEPGAIRKEKGQGAAPPSGNAAYGDEENVPQLYSRGFVSLLLTSGSLLLVFPVFVHGILKDGVVSWVPTFISETFASGAHTAILLTSVLPLINLSGAYMGRFAFKKMKNDEIRAASLFFALAVAAVFLLLKFGSCNMFLTALILSVVTASMMAVNTLLINLYPLRFEREGRVASVSGFLNASAYLGTAVSTYCIGLLVQGRGWEAAILSWLAVTAAAFAVCLVCCKRLKRTADL